jgi:hypothetical protein
MNPAIGDLWIRNGGPVAFDEGPVAAGGLNTPLIHTNFSEGGFGQFIFKIFLSHAIDI